MWSCRRLGLPWILESSRLSCLRRCPHFSLRSVHFVFSWNAQFVVIWLITCWTEGLIHIKVFNNARKRILLSHSLIDSELAGQRGSRVSVLGRESRSKIHEHLRPKCFFNFFGEKRKKNERTKETTQEGPSWKNWHWRCFPWYGVSVC